MADRRGAGQKHTVEIATPGSPEELRAKLLEALGEKKDED
jgi:hypothetical protein